MDIREAARARRTVRRFSQKPIDRALLVDWVDCARLSPSASNRQPLRYRIIDDPARAERIFPLTRWAALLGPQGTPTPGERPTAYILLLADRTVAPGGCAHDTGAAAQTIQLLATGHGVGCCWMGAIDRDAILAAEGLDPERYALDTLLALGYAAEEPVFEDAPDGDVRYYRDETGRHRVRKRTLGDVLI
ncbi:MAG: nitroreductase family protein [Clostridiales bacterium]|nr:nitroreductase family protein [Clostridiales bacterium]